MLLVTLNACIYMSSTAYQTTPWDDTSTPTTNLLV
jgi:hypothetical protein